MLMMNTKDKPNYFEKIEVRWLFLFGQICRNSIKRTELSHIAANTKLCFVTISYRDKI